MHMMRVLRVAAVALLAVLATGCGAEKQPSTSNAAEIVPASAPAFIAVDSDLHSNQWQQVDELLDAFPGKAKLLSGIRSGLREDPGLEYERDVKPALGKEVDIVWLDFENGGSNVVALTQPRDEAAFRRMVDKGNENETDQLLIAKVAGWTVVSDTQAKLDRFREEASAKDKLSDDETFAAAIGELPDEAVAKAYVRGQDLVNLFQKISLGTSGLLNLKPEQRPEFVAAALSAEKEGIRFVGVGRAEREPKEQSQPYASKLVDDVPADALLLGTVRGGATLDEQLGRLRSDPESREALREFERMSGVRLESFLGLFENEVAFYMRSGGVIPELTFLLEAPDEDAVVARVDQLLTPIARMSGAKRSTVTQDGVRITSVDFGPVAVRYAGFEGKIVITTGVGAISEIRSGGPSLADDKDYRDARATAGVPDKTPGLFYVNLKRTLPVVLGYLQLGTDAPADLEPNLEPLRSLVAWSESDGRTSTVTAFLRID